jgi:hypothetical protein
MEGHIRARTSGKLGAVGDARKIAVKIVLWIALLAVWLRWGWGWWAAVCVAIVLIGVTMRMWKRIRVDAPSGQAS